VTAPTGADWLIGHRLLDHDGSSIGRIGQVYYDDHSGRATWVTVRTGLFGTRENLVPLRQARVVDEGIQVPYPRAQVKSAPSVFADRPISVAQEDTVYAHYGMAAPVPAPRDAEPDVRPRGRHARPAGGGPGTRAQGDGAPAAS
jgi:hypothetical protein